MVVVVVVVVVMVYFVFAVVFLAKSFTFLVCLEFVRM